MFPGWFQRSELVNKAQLTLLGSVLVVAMHMSMATPSHAGKLVAYTFEDVVIIWKSEEDLGKAVDLMASNSIRDGMFDDLLECWVSSGEEAQVISKLAEGLLLKVRVTSEDCEGVVFSEEYVE